MSHQACENCHKNVATVTVIEVPPHDAESAGPEGQLPHSEAHLCEICAQAKKLPNATRTKKSLGDIWKLLQASGVQQHQQTELTCPECGMTQSQLRSRGRVGCSRDYEVFADDIRDLLERVHGATEHIGRVPGQSSEELAAEERDRRIRALERHLESAVRDEEYETAARIRDELSALGADA